MRLFLAALPQPSLLKLIVQYQKELALQLSQIRWLLPETLHITVAFIGEISAQQACDLQGNLESWLPRVKPFTLRINLKVQMVSPQNPRVLVLPLQDPERRLAHLQKDLSRKCQPLRIKTARPHLSIGRCNPRSLVGWSHEAFFSAQPLLGWQDFSVSEIHLMRAILTSAGAIYGVVKTFVLDELPAQIP